MTKIDIHGGQQTFHINPPTQRELELETRTKRVTLVFTDSEIQYFSRVAKQRGYTKLGPFLRKLITIGNKYEKHLNQTLDDILG